MNGHFSPFFSRKKRIGSRLAALLLSLTMVTALLPSAYAVGEVSESSSSEVSSDSSSETSDTLASSDNTSDSESSESSSDSSETSETSSSDSSSETSSEETDSSDSSSTIDPGFTVNSGAVYLVNMDSGTVIYEKNADTPMYPASLVKIMTTLLAIENCDDLTGTVVTTSYTVFDNLWGQNASNAGLYPGEEIRMIDLLYAVMLRSGCDAAGAVAEAIGGSEEAFVEMMNEKAAEIGCTSTHFVNSTGLHDDNQYTTAKDIYLITAYAMQYDIFKEIATTYSYTMPATNKNEERTISHTCSIMNSSSEYYNEYVHAIKTGTTDESGRNLVSYASKDAYNYMLVTMGAPIYYADGSEISTNLCYEDTLNFYDWAFNDWAVQTIVKTTDVKGQVVVDLCSSKDRVNAVPEEDVSQLMLKSIDSSALQMTADLIDRIDAPVTQGQVLGTLEIKMNNQVIATVNLVAAESLKKSSWLAFMRGLKNFFTSPILWLTILALFIGFAAWVYIMRQININKRRRRHATRKGTGSSYSGVRRTNSSPPSRGSRPMSTRPSSGRGSSGRGRSSARGYTPGSQVRKSSNYKGPTSSTHPSTTRRRPR